jgi:L-ribulose-5-phosphate 3-epimerase
MQFALFTDNLSSLDLPAVCRAAREAGFDGLDLTLRPGGHVLPENAEMGLAEARRAADAAGVALAMATTAITDADSPHAEQIFASAAHYGIRRLKLGYWPYAPFGTAARQLDQARAALGRVADLARKYHVLPCVHVHSGAVLANSGSLVYLLLRDFAPDEVGAYVDPMHMTLEGGGSGWEIGLDLVSPWLGLVGMKDFRWIVPEAPATRADWRYCPLGQGQVPMREFIGRLRELRYDGVVSLHSEYTGGHSFKPLSTPELLAQSAADLTYLRGEFGR